MRMFLAGVETVSRGGQQVRRPAFSRTGVTEWAAHELRPGQFICVAQGINTAPANTIDLGATVGALLGSLPNARKNTIASRLGITRQEFESLTLGELLLLFDTGTWRPNLAGKVSIGLAGVTLLERDAIQGGAVEITEPFTYSNGRLSTVSSAAWDDESANMNVSSNTVVYATNSSDQIAINNTQISSADHYAQVSSTLSTTGEYAGGGIVVRSDGSVGGTADGYRCEWSIVNEGIGTRFQVYVVRIDNDATTDVASTTNIASPDTSAHTIKVEAEGSTLRTYIDSTLRNTYASASSYTTNRYTGVYCGKYNGGNITLDNFEAGTLGGTNGTATPAAIAVTTTLPAVTKQAGGTRAPAAIAAISTLPAPSAGGNATAAPAAIASPATLPAPTPLAGATPAPTVIAVPVTLPAPTTQAGEYVTDDFNRTSGDIGANWTALTDSLEPVIVDDNHIEGPTNDVEYFAYWNADTFDDDQSCQIDATIGLSFSAIGPTVRNSVSVKSCYFSTWSTNNGGEYLIEKFVNGTHTPLDSVTGVGATGTRVMRLEATGTALVLYVDDVEVVSTTDSDLASGQPGVFFYRFGGSTADADNFEAGPTAAAMDGTATPSVIASPTTLPGATAGGHATRIPAAIAAPVTIPQATPQAGSTTAPAAITVPVTLPAATASGSTAGTATPAAIAAVVTVPAVTTQAGAVVTPAAITATVSIPQASASGSNPGSATPAAITATATLPAVTKVAGSTVTPTVIAVPVTLPAPTAQAGATVAPTVIPVTVSLAAVTRQGGASGSPAVITIPVTLPAVSTTQAGTATPDTIDVVVTIGQVAAGEPVEALAFAITVTVRDHAHTATVKDAGRHTATVRSSGHTATTREQR